MFEQGVFRSLEKRYTKFRDSKKVELSNFKNEML